MTESTTWNPLTDWKDTHVDWVKVNISKEELKRFTQRSNIKGLAQSLAFLLVFVVTGALAYMAFVQQRWILMAIALYFHGTFYNHFGDAIHELTHNTVFESRRLSAAMTILFGWLFWPWNPYFYKLSHQTYHHRYTLYQETDGEDAPNYVELKPRLIYDLFLRVFEVRALLQNVARLLTLKPTSKGWRGRGYRLDTWERFILDRASPNVRRRIQRFAVFSLISHAIFIGAAIYFNVWFLIVLITLAPFYGAFFHGFLCSSHQHAACDANDPDFRKSCGDAILDPLSSMLYWHMEYHIEHHMFAGIPCYNLKAFSKFVADQLPPKEHALPRLLKLHKASQEKFGTWQNWRDNYGIYKGF